MKVHNHNYCILLKVESTCLVDKCQCIIFTSLNCFHLESWPSFKKVRMHSISRVWETNWNLNNLSVCLSMATQQHRSVRHDYTFNSEYISDKHIQSNPEECAWLFPWLNKRAAGIHIKSAVCVSQIQGPIHGLSQSFCRVLRDQYYSSRCEAAPCVGQKSSQCSRGDKGHLICQGTQHDPCWAEFISPSRNKKGSQF
jgi:hypothetical protein